jgi:DNA-binding HxlR family transcriptional regulator/putative sterol carrier protein
VTRRGYNQFCATARSLDLLGERWTLLIIRELLSGPKRFSDLQRNLPGLGAALLSSRLRYMESEGLVRRSQLPAPTRAPAYELTTAGRELKAVVMALAKWGMRWALDERGDDDAFEPGWAVLGLEAIFEPAQAEGVDAVFEFRVDDETLHARIEDGVIDGRYGPAERPEVVIKATADAFARLASGELRLVDAIREGTATVTGGRASISKLGRLFKWPERRARASGEGEQTLSPASSR